MLNTISQSCSRSVKAILVQHHSKFEGDQSRCCVPWDQVVLTCVEHTLTSLDSDLWISGFHDDDPTEMVLPVEWLRAQANTSLRAASHMTRATITTPRAQGRRYAESAGDWWAWLISFSNAGTRDSSVTTPPEPHLAGFPLPSHRQ